MVKDKEKAFVFYERWYTQLQRLPPEEKLLMYEAICRYAFRGEVSDMAYYLESLMDNIRMAINNDKEKQQKFLELQRQKSQMAIEARKRKYAGNNGLPNNYPQQPAGNNGLPNNYPQQPAGNNGLPNNKNKNKNKELKQEQEQKNENENKNKEQELKQEENNIFDKSEICLSNQRFDEAGGDGQKNDLKQEKNEDLSEEEEKRRKEEEKKLREEEKRKKDFARMIVDFFNRKVKENNSAIKPVLILTDKRLHAITARAKEYGENAEDYLKTAIVNATTSQFLNGFNKKGWTATFDWMMLPNNFPKVLECNYDNKTINNNGNGGNNNFGSGGTTQQDMDRGFAAYAHRKLFEQSTTEVPEPLQDSAGVDG